MKVFLLNEPGGTDNLKMTELPMPVVKAGEVLVQVKAISINPVDVKARAYAGVLSWVFGAERPVVLGWDISGTVTATGEGVKRLKAGDEVFGMVNFIGHGRVYAEYVVAPESHLALKPGNISHPEAAGASMAALTAWQVLRAGNVKPGDRVLIHGASGGVGHFAVQIAKHLGATVIGTASQANADFVRKLGADECYDYATQQFEKLAGDIDFVLDAVQGSTLTHSIEVVRKGGAIITIPSPAIPEADQQKAVAKGVKLSHILVHSNGDDMASIAHLLGSGRLKTHIAEQFSFENMPSAHARLERGNVRGKIVVTLS
ncbi:MAG: NADP-dependent oxidoreductase [Haliscomenobacteraceae bacterium CHB4]|nr:L-threonine 3-dehydrogenase [Saprospiraceae bacterium]MCE7926369.1 NADP-dependent oxidoreductase [Haliscomenobacteraceae bacterium CHB4]